MPDDTTIDSFRQNVVNSPVLLNRWTAYTDQILAELAADGINVAKEDLAKLDSVRLYVLTGEVIGDYKEQARLALPEFARAAEARELREAIAREDHARHAEAVDMLDGMTPEQKLQHARSIGAVAGPRKGSATKRSDMTPDEKAAALARVEKMPRSMRIGEARRLGLE